MRISRPQMFMEIAHVVSKRSTCFRLNVGALVVINNRIVSIGYNGAPSGAPHCLGNACPGAMGCHETIHAEDNALRHVPHSLRHEDKDLYVTDSPCLACTDRIIADKVKRLFFGRPYRLNEHLELLVDAGCEVYQVTPSGYVVDWFTRAIVDEE